MYDHTYGYDPLHGKHEVIVSTNACVSDVREALEPAYLYSLLRLTKKLELAHNYDALIKALADEIQIVTGYNTAWVYLLGDTPNIAHLLVAQENVGITDKLPSLDINNDAFLQEIAAADHIVIVEDARTDPRTDKEIVEMLGNRSIINVPIHLADKKIGTIGTGSFGDEGVRLPSKEQLDYFSAMASHAAVALDRLRLFKERLAAEQAKVELQKQLAHVQRLESLGLLAGGIAHDFNNILTVITGNIELAELELDADAPSRPFLDHIGLASQRGTDLCNQMLAYAGHRTAQPEPIHLSQSLQEMASLLEVSIAKNIQVQYLLDEKIPTMHGDIAQIQQVMMNLISNANEAIGNRDGTITVSTGRLQTDQTFLDQLSHRYNAVPGDYIFFEVCDTGCGMDQQTREKLFDPFFTTKVSGRGLGMSAVLGIIQSHQGALSLDSELGDGTTFKVLFPTTSQTVSDANNDQTAL